MDKLLNEVQDDSRLQELKPDCERCFGLCCVALPFAASADFPVDKSGGTPCRNLRDNNGCAIHKNLRTSGYSGCSVFECFGAGQKVSQITFNGNDWRKDTGKAQQMFNVFPVIHQLHEMLWYLAEAMGREEAASIYEELDRVYQDTERLTLMDAEDMLKLDIPAHRTVVNKLLLQTSELIRTESQRKYKRSNKSIKKAGKGADLIGARLKNACLRGGNLRGAYLIAADLRGADLRESDLIGADFRDADISGVDFTGSLFLTQVQVNAAKGNASTKLPRHLKRPAHWKVF